MAITLVPLGFSRNNTALFLTAILNKTAVWLLDPPASNALGPFRSSAGAGRCDGSLESVRDHLDP